MRDERDTSPALSGLEAAAPVTVWSPGQTAAARALGVSAVLAGVAYVAWRVGFTIDWSAWWIAVPFVALEAHLVVRQAITVYELWDQHGGPRAPAVDIAPGKVAVFIATYDEGPEVLLPTIAAACRLQPAHETWVLDDGRRPEVAEMAAALGAYYVTRPDNAHAKAGNLNHALGLCDAEFVAVLDADHVPEENFLRHTLGYFADARVALVQTPQEFYNGDSFIHSGPAGHHDEQFFHRVIMPGKNRNNAAFWCGTNAVLRTEALRWIGGVSTATITEDMHTTVRLHRTGWKTVHHNEVLARGLAPRNYGEFQTQRWRWGAGSMQSIVAENPLLSRGLSRGQRMMYFASALSWFDSWRTFGLHLIPALVLLTGVSPVVAPLWQLLLAVVIVHGLSASATRVLGRGRLRLLSNMVFELLKMPPNLSSSLVFFKPRRLEFSVTPKGRSGSGRTRSAVPRVLWSLLVLDLLTWFVVTLQLAGVVPMRVDRASLALLGLGWVLVNSMFLLLAIDRIRRGQFGGERRGGLRVDHQLPAAVGPVRARTLDVSLSGASLLIRGQAPADGTRVAVQFLVGGRIASLVGVTRRAEATRVRGVSHIGVEFEPGQWADVAVLAEGLFREGVSTALVTS